jgi:hypothetical protein
MFRNLDLYKIIILLSIVLLPVAGFFAWWANDRLDLAQRSILEATKQGGLLEKIGQTQAQLQTIKENNRQGGTGPGSQHLLYFDRQIMKSAAGGLSSQDFQIGDEAQLTVSKPRATDFEVKIDFKRENKPLFLRREFIDAMLWNCEASSAGVWKLRALSLKNKDALEAGRKKPPPRTVEDEWRIDKLVFARREPDRKGK